MTILALQNYWTGILTFPLPFTAFIGTRHHKPQKYGHMYVSIRYFFVSESLSAQKMDKFFFQVPSIQLLEILSLFASASFLILIVTEKRTNRKSSSTLNPFLCLLSISINSGNFRTSHRNCYRCLIH
jgi:hypothetical protein